MPRPKLKSDDEVLEAATVVLKRCGPIEFTLSGVAKEVGLSRAALIQRFTNRDTLLVRMMERGVEQVRHYLNAIPIGAGPQGLWEFLQVLVRSMNTRNDFSVNYLISWYELQVPELRTLAIQRNRAVVEGYGCAGLAVLCIFGGWFAPYGIDQQFLGYQLLPPSWSRYGEVSFFLGTDDLGRDVLSRLLSGAAPTVGGAFVVTLAATICGLVPSIARRRSTGGMRRRRPRERACAT